MGDSLKMYLGPPRGDEPRYKSNVIFLIFYRNATPTTKKKTYYRGR